jgi:membrane protease YdiL (CAAX protease family)
MPEELETEVAQKPKLAWGPTAAIIVSIAAYIASQLILIIPATLISRSNGSQNIDQILQDSSWLQLVLTGISSIGILAVLWLFLRSRKQKLKSLGFARIKPSDFGWLAIALVSYFIILALTMAVVTKIPGFNADQVQDVGYKTATAGWQLVFAFIGLVVLPPLAEEMLFRGFMYRGLASKWPRIIAALVTSLLFALVHFQWNVGVDVFILSLVLIALYEKTKNLWMSVFLHAIKNGLAFVALFVLIN